MDERLAPLFAINAGMVGGFCRLNANSLDAGSEFGDQFFRAIGGMDDGADQANVREDVGERVRRERQHWAASAQNGRQRLHAIGDGGDHQIRFDGQQFFHGGGPGVGNDFQIAMGELRQRLDAVAGAGDQIVETAEPLQGESDAGLQRRDAQWGSSGAAESASSAKDITHGQGRAEIPAIPVERQSPSAPPWD